MNIYLLVAPSHLHPFSVATDNHRYHNNRARQAVEQDLSVLCYDGMGKEGEAAAATEGPFLISEAHKDSLFVITL